MKNRNILNSLYFFKENIYSLSLITLPIVIPLEIFTFIYEFYFINEETGWFVTLLPVILSSLLYPIYSVAIVIFISSKKSGIHLNLKELYLSTFKYWLSYIITATFIGIMFVGGLILFIIPGLIYITRYSFAKFEVVLNNELPLDAMKNSWDSTKKYKYKLIFGYTIITLLLYAPIILFYLTAEENNGIYDILKTISNIIYPVLNVIYVIYAYRIYEQSKNIIN